MKNRILLITILLLMIPLCFAVTTQKYEGIPILVSEDLNKTECVDLVKQIPDKYLIGLNSISFFNSGYENIAYVKWTTRMQYPTSYYFWNSKRIKINNGCDFGDLIHELAHHKNKMDKYTFAVTLKHGDIFMKAKQEIRDSIK